MRIIPLVLSALACLDAVPTEFQQTPDKVVQIDGAKNPELIPDYLVWEHAFGALTIIREKNLTLGIKSLKMSDADLSLVFAEAKLQTDRDNTSVRRQRKRREELSATDAKPAEILAEMRKIILEARWAALEARDRLLDALSTDGRAALLEWVELRRPNITAHVPEWDLQFFRLPH